MQKEDNLPTASNRKTADGKKNPAGKKKSAAGGKEKTEDRKKNSARAERLDKILAQEGLGTRSEIKKAIRSGKALVNGQVEKDAGRQVFPSDEILFQGRKIDRERFVYYMLNKPAGVITATEDSRQKTVLDLLREPVLLQCPVGEVPLSDRKHSSVDMQKMSDRKQSSADTQRLSDRKQGPVIEDSEQITVIKGLEQGSGSSPVLRRDIFPVGRLDKDTEGLLLITDDGQLAHRLLAPGKHVDKTYYAVVSGTVTEEDVRQFSRGLRIDDTLTAMPARLQILSQDGERPEQKESEQDKSEQRTPDRKSPAGEESEQRSPDQKSPAGEESEQKSPVGELGGMKLPPEGAEQCEQVPQEALFNKLLPDQAALRELLPPDITEYSQTFVTIREGKFHQIKRMFAAVGKEVLYLKRLSMGPLWLDPSLSPGQFRKLTEEELENLLHWTEPGRKYI